MLAAIPKEIKHLFGVLNEKNGEGFIRDEAEVWKRIIQYRLALESKPKNILETHAGKGLGTEIYKIASSGSSLFSLYDFKMIDKSIKYDFIDVDPCGFCYSALEYVKDVFDSRVVVQVSNGEVMSIVRNLPNRRIKTNNIGKNVVKAVENEMIPYISALLGLKIQFYYIYPTTCRLVFSNFRLDNKLFEGCNKYMGWVRKYV